ncbi:OTU domain-containing protein 3 [Grifola frondosa]|uniref:OTU domain-containing protein 3 n=1 Tax=Grifola frondosa TaxID=5627 RepID=A0A1C7MCJ8_GRIFR|nr:OTU domain-containing protein 3 [Grifola frondosa]
MVSSKRKTKRPAPQLRSRTTRSKGKPLVNDPAENGQLLTEQLRALGLYEAPTLGDGNCLFRALSDQLYGTQSHHLELRRDICDWIQSHKSRYEPFVDDERGLDVHLQCMRQQATYGGHLELSAFAHMLRRDVKVIQPGLVYVIEWAAGADPTVEITPPSPSTSMPDDSALDDREKRRLRRERRRSELENKPGPVYIASRYHDWEHFSSIRSLRGPHTGIPNVIETPAPEAPAIVTATSVKKKPLSKAKLPATLKRAVKTRASAITQAGTATPRTPSQIPLPASRSPSPLPSSAPASQGPSFPPLPGLTPETLPRAYRSPKRTFDESSASSQALSESSQGAAKRAKSSSRATSTSRTPNADLAPHRKPLNMEVEELDTPDFSASGSSPASSSSLSSVPSPAPSPPPEPERRMTRRERKTRVFPSRE